MKDLNEQEPNKQPNYGELILSRAQLKKLDGYDSIHDDNALNTEDLSYRVDKDNFFISFYAKKEYYHFDPYSILRDVPHSIEFTFHDMEDDIRIWRITIPLRLIESVTFKSSVLDMYDNVFIANEYSCHVVLTNNKAIRIKGSYHEETEYWYYEHEVTILTY